MARRKLAGDSEDSSLHWWSHTHMPVFSHMVMQSLGINNTCFGNLCDLFCCQHFVVFNFRFRWLHLPHGVLLQRLFTVFLFHFRKDENQMEYWGRHECASSRCIIRYSSPARLFSFFRRFSLSLLSECSLPCKLPHFLLFFAICTVSITKATQNLI